MKALIIAENQDAAAEMGAAARGFADEVVALGIGTDLAGVADKSLKVSVPDDRIVEDAWATVCAIADAEQPARVLVEPTTRLSGVAGRLAAHMGAAVITDVLALGPDGATSLYFGGAGERTVAPVGDVALCTVSRGVFDGAGTSGTDAVEEVAFVDPANPVVRVAAEPLEKSDVNLAAADVVVGAGRGFAEESELDLARALCDKLGAGLACSRPLTEGVNWLPTELYVGVSGLMLSPKVYVAAGISGQMQHMVGCNRSGAVFAINKDKNAPVFKQCDYGLVGDIKDVLPALTAAL